MMPARSASQFENVSTLIANLYLFFFFVVVVSINVSSKLCLQLDPSEITGQSIVQNERSAVRMVSCLPRSFSGTASSALTNFSGSAADATMHVLEEVAEFEIVLFHACDSWYSNCCHCGEVSTISGAEAV